MATKVWADSAQGTLLPNRGVLDTKFNGSTSATEKLFLNTVQPSGSASTKTMNTVAGPTSGIEVLDSGLLVNWISLPVSADVTISGAITANIWAIESAMNANVAINFAVYALRAIDGAIDLIVKSARTTEVSTSLAVNNFTATPGAGVTVNKGDRLLIRIFGDDAGTMGTGFTFGVSTGATSVAASGDTWFSFTETFTFTDVTVTPSGTTLYLRDSVSPVDTASVDKEAKFTTAGSTVTKATNTQTGWVAPIQMTDGAGGTVIDWFSDPLLAFTLTGFARGTVTLAASNVAANANARLEIARVDADGSNPQVWAAWGSSQGSAFSTTASPKVFHMTGDDLAFTDGQRIRIRVYIDDFDGAAMVTGHTVSVSYNNQIGTSGEAEVILEQTLTALSVPRSGVIDSALGLF